LEQHKIDINKPQNSHLELNKPQFSKISQVNIVNKIKVQLLFYGKLLCFSSLSEVIDYPVPGSQDVLVEVKLLT
jgi:hypothetical protein